MLTLNRERGLRAWSSRHNALVSSAVLLAVSAAYLLTLARRVVHHSDDASVILQAYDIVQGNVLLHGWVLGNSSFYTTDTLLYALTMAATGGVSSLMTYVPVGIATAIITLCAYISGYLGSDRFRPIQAAITTVVIVAMPPAIIDWFLHGPDHNGAYGLILGCIALQSRGSTKLRARLLWLVLATMAALGDTFTYFVYLIPIALVSANEFRSRPGWNSARALALAILPCVIASVLAFVMHSAGGFDVRGVPIAFVQFDRFGFNVSLFVNCFLDLFGANFFGGSPKDLSLIRGGFALALGLFAIWHALRSPDGVQRTLGIACLVILIAFLVSRLPDNRDSVRYMIPIYLFSAILLPHAILSARFFRQPEKFTFILFIGLCLFQTIQPCFINLWRRTKWKSHLPTNCSDLA